MLFDICLKIRDLGDIYGSFVKSTANNIYLSNAIFNKASGVSIALIKIEKKFIVTASRIGTPSFDNFTDEQLQKVISLKNPNYTSEAQKILDSRKKTSNEIKSVQKPKAESSKPVQTKAALPVQEKKEWDQFEANKKLFGVEPSFNVDEYACTIDRKAPEYDLSHANAEKIAKELEIESSKKRKSTENITDDMLYSTVKETNKWTDLDVVESPVAIKIAELKKQLSLVENEIIQQSQDFSNDGWNVISKLLSKKKAIANELEMLINPPPKAQETLSSPTKHKKSNEKANKADDVDNDQVKPPRNKDKQTPSPKKHEQRPQKQIHVEIPAKFNSATEIVDFISKNFHSGGKSSEFKSFWSDLPCTKESGNTHLKPLESFEFSQEKILEIQKATSERKAPYSQKSYK